MREYFHRRTVLKALFTSVAGTIILSKSRALAQGNPLPSWRDGKAKQSILDFVATVTREGSPGFVPVSQRVATFDNDGTLWCEQPMYVQLAFALDQVKARAREHPEWKKKQPFKAVLDGDMKALAASGERGLVEILMATHADMSTDTFERVVMDWLSKARHPRFKRPYTELCLSTDARIDDVSAGERFQNLHRVGWRHRVHAAVDGASLMAYRRRKLWAQASRQSSCCAGTFRYCFAFRR